MQGNSQHMSTVIFFMLPEKGHLNPSFKIARILQRRGHQVCYLGTLDCGDHVRSQGIPFFPVLKETLPRGFLNSVGLSEQGEKWLKNPDTYRHLIADQATILNIGQNEIVDLVNSL